MPRPPSPEKLRKVTVRLYERDYWLMSRVKDMNSAVREAVHGYCDNLLASIRSALEGYKPGQDETLDQYKELLDEMERKEARRDFKSIHYR